MEQFNAVTVSERILLRILEVMQSIENKIENNNKEVVHIEEIKEMIVPKIADGGKLNVDNISETKGKNKKGK